MITLKLEIDGKQKEYKQKSLKVRAMRELMKFQVKMDKVQAGEIEMTPLEQIDQMILLIEQIFDNPEVNFDNIIDGIEANQLEDVLKSVFDAIGGGDADTPKKAKKTSQK